MIENSYTYLDGFLVALRLGLALLVVGLGVAAVRGWRPGMAPEDRRALEDRSYLLSMAAVLLVGLNVASWPLFYLLLQSYVPQWPGVMCIYGVTRIGTGRLGPARFLPILLEGLQIAKPALVFASGAWLALYLLNRRTETAPLTGRVLAVLLLVGMLAAADAAAEGAYLVIPKKEDIPDTGCCARKDRKQPGFFGNDARPWLYGAYYATSGVMLLGLAGYVRRLRRRPTVPPMTPALAGALAAAAAGAMFLVDAAAPTILGLPHHHCPYDLVEKAPEAVAGVALFVAATFAVGWACVLAWCGRSAETRPLLPEAVRTLLLVSLGCYLGSLVLVSTELALAT